jgi:DNA-binding NtrC family response regulator
MATVPVETVLLKAGYKPTIVADPDEFDQALSQGGWDLVLADLNDSAAVRAQMGDEAPMLVPVLYAPTKSDFKQAKQEYDNVIKAPVKSQRFLESVDDAVAMLGE